MKVQQIILAAVISLSSIVVGNTQENYSIIKGKVVDWPTDTVYLQTMPFHSPFSSSVKIQILDKDSTFSFQLEDKGSPLVVQLYSKKGAVNLNKEELLSLNYTNDYYYGHCVKFYTYGVSTFLLEPGNVLNVELKSNQSLDVLSPETAGKYRKLGAKIPDDNSFVQVNETAIKFIGDQSFQSEYFQKTFNLEDKVDQRLELYQNKPIEKAIKSYTKITNKLLNNHETEKEKLSPLFYEYIKAEIEFGARVEFLKYLMLSNKVGTEAVDSFFSKEISQDILDIVEFNEDEVTPTIMTSELYNKYLELYVNFKINVQNRKLSIYNEFSIQKCETAIRELPKESVYYYIAGQLLHTLRTEDWVEELVIDTITKFSDGELNAQLMEMYDL